MSLLNRVWCHECKTEVSGILREADEEWQCSSCNGTFVEAIDQNVDQFLNGQDDIDNLNNNNNSNDNNSSGSNSSSNSSDMSSHIIQRIMSRLVGNGLDAPMQNVMVNDNLGTPVGIVVQRSDSNQDNDPLGGLLSSLQNNSFTANTADSETNNQSQYQPSMRIRNIINLVSSLTFARSSINGFVNSDQMGSENNSLDDFLSHFFMSELSQNGAPPASQSVIEGLSRVTVTPETDVETMGECSISQELFQAGDVAVKLPCGHLYKEELITQWLKLHNTCPTCREVCSS